MEHRQLYIDLGRKNSATEKRNVKWTSLNEITFTLIHKIYTNTHNN